MRNPFRGIRWKIVWLCLLSVVLAYSTSYLIRQLARAVIRVYPSLFPISTIDQTLNEVTGFRLIPVALLMVLFVFYLLLLSRSTVDYIKSMSSSVHQVSEGNFDNQIPVQARDELGELAANINHMTQQLRTSLEEERLATQAKNDLITNVSHDLRTPLTSIIGYLGIIDEDKYLDEIRLRHYINIAYTKSVRLGNMVNDLFEYTRMNYGKMTLQNDTINLNDLLNQLVADFNLLLSQSHLTLRLDLPTEKLTLNADGDKLMRLFENLIQNAIKYSEAGKFIDIHARSEEQKVVVDIVNYGSPIPQADLPHVFERFYRVDKSRSEGSSGLGLAIVQSIAGLHGGDVQVESDDIKTRFTVSLPQLQNEIL